MQLICKKCSKNLHNKKNVTNFASQNKGETLETEKQIEKNAKIAQLVEHNLAKVGVAGSSPVFRSIFVNTNCM